MTLASSNSFSYSKQRVSLRTYVEQHMQPQDTNALANETWYLFGDTRGGRWDEVRAPLLPHSLEVLLTCAAAAGGAAARAHGRRVGRSRANLRPRRHAQRRRVSHARRGVCGGKFGQYNATIILASSIASHAAQVLHGEKLWFLSPPSHRPLFDGNVTQMQVAQPPAACRISSDTFGVCSGCWSTRIWICPRTAARLTSGSGCCTAGGRGGCSCSGSRPRC